MPRFPNLAGLNALAQAILLSQPTHQVDSPEGDHPAMTNPNLVISVLRDWIESGTRTRTTFMWSP